MVTADSSLRDATVGYATVAAKLTPTPIDPHDFMYFAGAYHVDPNWALSYLQWESGFGTSTIARANPTNPWDILSYPGQWGQSGDYDPGNGYRYASYPDTRTGLEAGFRLWDSYATRGWATWGQSLSVALCGNPEGCGGTWVANVIRTGQANESSDGGGDGGEFGGAPLVFGDTNTNTRIAIGLLAAAGLGVLMLAHRRGG